MCCWVSPASCGAKHACNARSLAAVSCSARSRSRLANEALIRPQPSGGRGTIMAKVPWRDHRDIGAEEHAQQTHRARVQRTGLEVCHVPKVGEPNGWAARRLCRSLD
eukprot:1845371-Pleurochrysis_carterae.AAC.2